MLFSVCRSLQFQTGRGLLFDHGISSYDKNTMNWNNVGQSFTMAKLEAIPHVWFSR